MTTTITALPTPPSRADDPTNFSSKADALLGALPLFVTQVNTVGTEMEQLKVDTQGIKDDAVADTEAIKDDAVAATTVVYNNTVGVYNSTVGVYNDTNGLKSDVIALKAGAEAARDLAEDYRDGALAAQGSAEVAAAAAGAAAGLPSLAGNAGKALKVNSGATGVEWGEEGLQAERLPIFSAAAAAALPVSVSEDIAFGCVHATGLSADAVRLAQGAGLFVASVEAASSNVATSPNGKTWTLRAMPVSGNWSVGHDGSTRFLACAANSTAIATSTDGITWSAGTALPGNAGNTRPKPVFNGGTWLVPGQSSTVYTSTDGGATWNTQTFPVSITQPANFFKVGSHFWFIQSSSAYYSTTGATGSWTTVALPVSFAAVGADAGQVYFVGTGVGAQIYRVDGVSTFTAVSGLLAIASGRLPHLVNGVMADFSTTFGESRTQHAAGFALRTSQATSRPGTLNDGTNWVIPCTGGQVVTINLTDSPTAVFED